MIPQALISTPLNKIHFFLFRFFFVASLREIKYKKTGLAV